MTALGTLVDRVLGSRVAWGMASTGFKAVSGVVVLAVALAHLDPRTIGLWYVFVGIGALVQRCDFGFAATVLRWSSKLRAPDAGPGHLGGFTRAVCRLYLLLLLLGAAIVAGGTIYLMGQVTDSAEWCAWGLFASGTLLSLFSSGDLALASGAERVRAVQQIGLAGAIAGSAASLGGLLGGMGVVAMGLGMCVNALVVAIGARRLAASCAPGADDGSLPVAWWKDLWPASWRTGVMGLGAFLIYYSNTFLAACYLGLAEAGRFGFTTSVFALLLSLASAPVVLAAPTFARNWARGDHAAVWYEFRSRRHLALAAYLVAATVVVVAGDWILHLVGSRSALLPTAQLAVLAVIYGLELNHILYASFAMSANHVPFASAAIISGIAVAVIGWAGVSWWGLWGLVLAVGLVQLSWNNWYPVWFCLRRLPRDRVE